MELRFTSALSPAELSGRLQKGAFLVKFNGMNFELGKIRGYRNDLAPRFCGVILEQGRGSIIMGTFRPHPALGPALGVALLFAGLFTLPSGQERLMHPALLITPCSFLLAGGFVALSGWMGQDEKSLLTDYLEACCRDQAPGAP